MAEDQQAPVDEQDQPIQDAAPDGTSGEADGFEAPFNINEVPAEARPHVERYQKQLQGAYTSKTQELAQQRQEYEQAAQFVQSLSNDPEVQQGLFQELAQMLGYEISEEEAQALAEGEDQQFLDPRVDALLAEREQELQERELDSLESGINDAIAHVGKAEGREFSQPERELLFAYTLALPPKGDQPDVKGAYDILKQAEEESVKRYVESKNAPSPAPQGQAGSPDIDLNDPRARKQRMAAIMQAAGQ